MDVADWLRALGLERYEAAFRENDVGADVLLDLTAEDLEGIGVASIGHRRQLLVAIARLREDAASLQAIRSIGDHWAPISAAERRQITVLFCDIVGSTPLSTGLDPEELREVLTAYQANVAAVVTGEHGYIARFVGDGVLAYFGWPNADESHAESAVRAGLAIIEAVRRQQLSVRIGIATGLVVTGDLVGVGAAQTVTAVGETPNLAARLQALAQPDTVVVSEATQAQLGRMFELADLGLHALKGFAMPVRVWRVLGKTAAVSRSEVVYASALTPLVGRDEELGSLLRRWNEAKAGEGRVVLLSGEPGIGKSRLLAALEERLIREPHISLRYFCSPHHQDSPLYPIIARLEREAGFVRGDTATDHLRKLEAALAPTPPPEDIALLAALLSIPTNGGYPVLELSPQQQKDRTVTALLHRLAGLAHRNPVLFLFEDAHWSDPSSIELLAAAVEQVPDLPVLLIVSFRPEFAAPWFGRPRVSFMALSRLDRRDATALAAGVVKNQVLSPKLLDRIAMQSDGVPLFIEELSKTVLEASESSGKEDATLAVPSTLQASLLARLDRLGPAREVAQIGAVIGRQFSHELISKVALTPRRRLEDALDQLVAAELVYRRGTPPDAEYTFKHALVQDAAYSTLLRGRRQQLHARIAEILDADFSERVLNEPHVLARHYSEAGLPASAVGYWEKAGVRAAKRSANKEAVAHLRKGLELVAGLPAGADRDARERHLLLALGPVLMTTHSSADPETGRVYARARQLARESGRLAELFPPLWGSWLVASTSDDITTAKRLLDELFAIANDQASPELLLQAHHAAWPTLVGLGELIAAQQHVESGLALYQADTHHQHAQLYGGHDPGVCGYVHGAIVRAVLGFPDEAVRQMDQGRALAESLGHPSSLSQALWFAAELCHLRREPRAVCDFVSAVLPLLREHGSSVGMANATMLRGWALTDEGRVTEGLADLRAGLSAWRATGSKYQVPYRLARAADAYRIAGDVDGGLALIAEALEAMELSQYRWGSAEVHRLRGELLLLADHSRDAETCLERALAAARLQSARLLELRAAVSLARLWRDQGECAKARDLLSPIYDWFTEGFDAPDLKDAKALLEQLKL
jgi:class 3 adenylate cyclase/predicted ATPase